MSGIALPTLNTDLQTGICTLQMLIPLQQKQAGDHSLGLSLFCQQSWDTAVMSALRNVAGKFWLISGSNKACISLPWQWRRLHIFIVSRLFIPKNIWWDSGVSARGLERYPCLPAKAEVKLVLMAADPLWKAEPCSTAKASRRGRNLCLLHLSKKLFT